MPYGNIAFVHTFALKINWEKWQIGEKQTNQRINNKNKRLKSKDTTMIWLISEWHKGMAERKHRGEG